MPACVAAHRIDDTGLNQRRRASRSDGFAYLPCNSRSLRFKSSCEHSFSWFICCSVNCFFNRAVIVVPHRAHVASYFAMLHLVMNHFHVDEVFDVRAHRLHCVLLAIACLLAVPIHRQWLHGCRCFIDTLFAWHRLEVLATISWHDNRIHRLIVRWYAQRARI